MGDRTLPPDTPRSRAVRPPRAVPRYVGKADTAYEWLRSALLAGEIAPGERIVADQVARELGVSRVPVREALVRLAGEGWVELMAHVGAIVPKLDPELVLETSFIRAVLEASAASLAMPYMDERRLTHLKELVTRLAEAGRTSSPEYPAINLAFHAAIVEPCPYRGMVQLVDAFAQKMMHFRTARILTDYTNQANDEHRALLGAIEAGNAEEVERLTRTHIEDAGVLLASYVRKPTRQLSTGS